MGQEEQGFDRMEEGGRGFMELMSSGGEDGAGFLFSSEPPPRLAAAVAQQMLCFGGKEEEEEPLRLHGVLLAQRSSENSSISSSLSSSPPPPPAIAIGSESSKKKAGRGGGRSRTVRLMPNCSTANKKPKTENSATAAHGGNTDIKARKEKLGDRIMSLQKLVSPFGKSDTASVLHEALGYIRFLQEQVQVLSCPYLQGSLPGDHIRDLRSRGLCLVPVSCMEHLTGSNGADLWSPATAARRSSGQSSPSSSSISKR